MASVFVPSYELWADGASLHCRLVFFGSDLQANPTPAFTTVTGIDFVNDNPTQIQTKVAAAIRTLSASIRNSTGAAGVTVPANGVILPSLGKG